MRYLFMLKNKSASLIILQMHPEEMMTMAIRQS